MRLNRLRIYGLLLLLTFFGCKEPEVVVFKLFGTMTDSTTSLPLSDVNIELSAVFLESGSFSNSYRQIETIQTGSDGSFSFNVERGAIGSFRVRYKRDSYFDQEIEINPDDIDVKNGMDISKAISPVSTVNLHLVNSNPLDDNDKITFRYTSSFFPDCACCNNSPRVITGADIDTVITCVIEGNHQMDYLYEVERNGSISPSVTGEEFVPAFSDYTIEIQY